MRLEDQNRPPEEITPLLRGITLFEELAEEDLHQLAAMVRTTTVEAEEVVFREGDEGDALFLIQEGRVELAETGVGGEVSTVAVRGPGEAFGEMEVLNDRPRSATARAISPCVLLRMEKDGFRETLANQSMALKILTGLSRTVSAQPVSAPSPEGNPGTEGLVSDAVWEMSRRFQRGLIPREAPRIQGFDVAVGTNLEEEGEGRTIWDFADLKDGGTALVTLNVQGEGLPPGHFLAVARGLFREIGRDHSDLKGLLARVNSGLAAAAVEGMEQFVEAGVLLPSRRGLEWAGAGRCPGAIIRRSGVFEEFASHGPPLGMMEGFLYGTQEMELGAGDTVIVLSEASQGLFRGAADLVASLQGKPVGEIVTMVHKALKKAHPDGGVEISILFARKQ